MECGQGHGVPSTNRRLLGVMIWHLLPFLCSGQFLDTAYSDSTFIVDEFQFLETAAHVANTIVEGPSWEIP